MNGVKFEGAHRQPGHIRSPRGGLDRLRTESFQPNIGIHRERPRQSIRKPPLMSVTSPVM